MPRGTAPSRPWPHAGTRAGRGTEPRRATPDGRALGDVRLGPVATAERGVGQPLGHDVDDHAAPAAARCRAPRRGCGRRRRRRCRAPRRRRMPGRARRARRPAPPAPPAATGCVPRRWPASVRPCRCAVTTSTTVLGLEPAEAGTVGKGEQGAGEPVTAQVRALPDLVGQRPGEGEGDRTPAHRAAGVAGGVGAHEHHRLGVVVALGEGRAEGAGRVEQVGRRAPGAAHPGAAHVSTAYQWRSSSPGGRRVGAAHEQHLAARTTAQTASTSAPTGPSSGSVSIGCLGPRPLVLDEQPAGGDGSGAGLRVTAVQRRGGAAREIGQGHPAMLCEVAWAHWRAVVSRPVGAGHRRAPVRPTAPARCWSRARGPRRSAGR